MAISKKKSRLTYESINKIYENNQYEMKLRMTL